MEGKIQDEVGDRSPSEVTELNLDNVRASVITGLTDKFSNLVKLSLVNVGLTSLENFPILSKLEQIELGDNKLSDGLNHLEGCPLITTVNLVGNRISSLDQLKPLAKLEKLKNLDLYGCPVTNQPGYRDQVFTLLPNLQLLDGLDKDGKEGQESSDEEEEDYEEGDDDEDDEPGLSYLQKDLGDSDESEQDYDPEEEDVPEEEDEPSDDGGSGDDDKQGQSSSGIKRRKMMPPQEEEQSDSD